MVGEDGDSKAADGSGKRVSAMAFYGYLNRYRSVFLPSLVALFVTAGLSLAFPYFLSSLIGSPTEAFRTGEEINVEAVMSKIDRTVLTLIGILALQAFIPGAMKPNCGYGQPRRTWIACKTS